MLPLSQSSRGDGRGGDDGECGTASDLVPGAVERLPLKHSRSTWGGRSERPVELSVEVTLGN
eukprot:5851255-Alexandrium_andersonii.AAC.1